MSKLKVVCFVLVIVLATAGTALVLRNLIANDIPDFDVPTEDLNTYIDLTDDVDITDPDADVREFLFIAHKVLLDGEGFYGVSKGVSVAAGITQDVLNTRYVIGDFDNKHVFKEMITKGFVSNAYQLYLTGNNYIYRKFDRVHALDNVSWQNTAQPLTRESFYSSFGHRNDKLTGYILNWETVTGGNFVSEDNGLYTFRYVLDNVTATTYQRREMITNGNLQGEPVYTKTEIYVTMDANFNVKELRTDCEYKVTLAGINPNCTQDITEYFEPYDGDLPYSDFFSDYLDQEGGDITIEETALDVLLDMFSPYLQGEPLQVEISAESQGISGLLSISGLDISDLSKVTVAARMFDIDLLYSIADSKLYLQYQDFKGSTTIDGLMELVGTIQALANGNTSTATLNSSALSDIDPAEIIESLTFSIDDDSVCTVNLPLSIAGLDINANLYADVDGKAYNFTHATIEINDIVINIEPKTWQVADMSSGDYPEITGLADLLQDGKISLTADVNLPLGDDTYSVNANVLFDLATSNLSAEATLGNNGKLNVALVDKVAYVAFGNVKLKLDTTNTDSLVSLLEKFIGDDLSIDTPNVSTDMILGALSQITVTETDGGVAFQLSIDNIDATLNLKSVDGRWNVDTIILAVDGIEATIAPCDMFGDVVAPADADIYADVTELVETFADPIWDIVNGETYGAEFTLALTLDGKTYNVVGSVACDALGALKLDATVYDGNVGIIDCHVIYANDTVFLTLNGVKVAFAVGGNSSSNVDIYQAIETLLANDEIKALLDNRDEITELVEQISAVVGVASGLQLSDLLDVDLSAVISRFSFVDGVLSVTVDGDVFGLDGLSLSVALANNDGRLSVALYGLQFANVALDIEEIVINTNIDNIEIPNTDDYVLNLHGEILGVEMVLTADFVQMDIWASARYNEEIALLRYVDGNIYVIYGGAKLVFDTSDIDVLNELIELFGDGSQSDALDSVSLLAVLSAISANLTGDEPNLSLSVDGISAQINFVNTNGILEFNNVTVSFELGGKEYVATLSQQAEEATKLDVDDEFVDGNKLIKQIVETVKAFKNIDSIELSAEVELTLNNTSYLLDVTFNYNDGIYANVVVKDENGKALVSAEIYVVDGVLYLDINGIRQAVELPDSANSKLDLQQVLGVISELEGISDTLDGVLQTIKQLPDKLDGIVLSKFIQDLYYNDSDKLVAVVNLDQLDLGGVTLTIGLGSELTLDVNGFAIDGVAVNCDVSVRESHSAVVAPSVYDYTTQLYVDLGNGMSAIVMLDIYHGVVEGQLNVTDKDVVAFKYVDGVVYFTYGNVGAKVALDDVPTLIGALGKFIELPETSQMDGNIIGTVKEWISKIVYERNETADGYSISVALDSVTVVVSFNSVHNKVTLNRIEIDTTSITITASLEHNLEYAKVDTNGQFVDVADVVETFAEPILNLINGSSYGADFELNVTLGDTDYIVTGNFALDVHGNIQVAATAYTDGVGIVDVDVIYANNTVFLKVNGIKVAFAVGKNSSSDVSFEQALDQLLANEQIKTLIDSHKELGDLIEQVGSIIGGFVELDVTEVNFAKLISSLKFEEGKLALAVNASDFELGNFDVTLAVNDGNLSVMLGNFTLASVKLNSVSATVLTDVSDIYVPSTKDYILNLHASVMLGEIVADVEISADLYAMDVWASVNINRETILVRYIDGNVYVKYGEVALKLDTAHFGEIIEKLVGIVNPTDNTFDIDVNDILADLSFNLTAEQPNISYNNGKLTVAVNFANIDGVLSFSDVTARFGDVSVEVEHNGDMATQLELEDNFVDGNKLVNQIFDTIDAFVDANGVTAQIALHIDIDGVTYALEIAFNYNNGLYATLKLSDTQTLLTAEIYLVDNTLYFDVNGIRQAVELPAITTDGAVNVNELTGILGQVRTILESLNNDVINSILRDIDGIPTNFDNLTYSEFISGMYYNGDTLVLNVNLAQLGLGAFTLSLDLGSELGLGVDEFVLGNVSMAFDTTVDKSNTAVTAPDLSTYVTELTLTVGNGITAVVKVDLFHNTVVGKAEIYDNTVNFKFVDGTIYATYGDANTSNVAVMFNTADINALLDAISKFVELPEMSFGGGESLVDTLMGILNKFSVARQSTANGYTLELTYDGIAVAISFNTKLDSVTLGGIELNAGNISANVQQVYGETYPDVATDGNYVDLVALANDLSDSIANLIGASGYSIGFDGYVTLGGMVYGINATVEYSGGNVHAIFSLSYDGIDMLDGELWIVDRVLYLQAGDLRFAVSLGENIENDNTMDIGKLQDTLNSLKGYNDYLDEIVDLVISILDKPVSEIDFEELLTSLAYNNGQLTVGINGGQYGVSEFTLGLSSADGLCVSLNNLVYNDIAVNINNANVAPYDGEINAPTEDFTTNLVIDVQSLTGASNEQNKIYVNIDFINGVLLARIETTINTEDGHEVTFLDVKYTFSDNVLKLTNGGELNVSVDINSIVDIVNTINDVVNDFANAGDQALPDLLGAIDIDLKAIVKSLSITSEYGNVIVGLKALGFKMTALFNGGLNSITVPVDFIESNLVASLSHDRSDYSSFPDDANYVSIDQVFNDYYYGDGTKDEPNGAFYNLITTNSWKFDFTDSFTSTITIGSDMYRIRPGSYIVFYFNKTEVGNSSVRANIKLDKYDSTTGRYDDFIILDVAYLDGRIFVSYDSDSDDPHGGNVLRATVAIDALMKTYDLLPALTKVIPQIGMLMDSVTGALDGLGGKLTLGNVSKLLQSASYNDKVFELVVNGQALDAVNFGSDPITLKVSEYVSEIGVKGLSLDKLSLSYGSVSVELGGLVVTGSKLNEQTGKFYYVEDYIMSYFSENGSGKASTDEPQSYTDEYAGYNENNVYGYNLSNHMNLDSIYELLSALAITAGNFDENDLRSFYVEGDIDISMNVFLLGDLIKLKIHVTMYADIDDEGNSYFAVKLTRDYAQASIGLLKYDVYDDYGGNSYLLFSSQTGLFTVARDSIVDGTVTETYEEPNWICTSCGAQITNTSRGCTNGGLFGIGAHGTKYMKQDGMRTVTTTTAVRDYESVLNGKPAYVREDLKLSELTANLTKTEGESPIFEMLNLGTISLLFGAIKVDLESTIREAIGQPNDSVYGVEDILKSYSYTRNEQDGGSFDVVADMSPINDVLGTLQLNILHAGNFDNLYYDERGILRGVSLTDITGQFDLFENSSLLNMSIELDLHHSTPQVYGTAEDYVNSSNITW